MSQEYYTLVNKKNIGETFIRYDVFEEITYATIKNIDCTIIDMPSQFLLSSKSPIRITLTKHNQLVIDVDVTLEYGVNVTTTTNLIQTKVITAMKEMFELNTVSVNVNIIAINF